MLNFTIDERDATPPEYISTNALREMCMALDADITRAKEALDLMQAELERRDEAQVLVGTCSKHGEYEADAMDSPCPSCEDGEDEDEDEDNEPGNEDQDDFPDDDDRSEFADPGGNSALRAASPSNPRNLPCPTCKEPNRLTPKDRALSYQCDSCANAAEQGIDRY